MPIVVNNCRAGEISARVDRLKSAEIVANGLLKAVNVTINPQGGVRKRPSLRHITQLPTGRNWARIFAWDKSEAERLALCYADNGEFRIMLQDGTLIDVEGRGNIDTQDVMQFYNQGNRVVFTDGTAPRHIIASPVNVGDRVILLTNETPDQAGVLNNYAVNPVAAYSPPADQPISLSSFNNTAKSARLLVGDLRSQFTPADGGAGAVTVFTNNPHTYKEGTTTRTITINSVTRQSDNRLRLALSQFPAWLDKAVVRWGSHSRDFTSANSVSEPLTGTALSDWNVARGVYSVELVRRPAVKEQARWNAGVGTQAMDANYGAIAGYINANMVAASGAFPTDTSGTWRLRRGEGVWIEGALTTADTVAGQVRFRVGTFEQMRGLLGGGDISSGEPFVLEQVINTPGLEANDADFYAMAVEYTTTGRRPVYIKGRDFYALNAAKGLDRLPLRNNRRVNALVVDDRFKNQPEVILQTFRERVLPLATDGGMPFSGDAVKTLLTVSDFLAFRPPALNPPDVYFDDAAQYAKEQERIGKRFCIATNEAPGGSLTTGEYELEWVAQTPVDEYDSQLIAVGGETTLSDANRPALTRRGVTNIFENSSGVITERTGWKYGTSTDIPQNLRGTVVNDNDDGSNDAIAAWGTLVARKIADNSANIGRPPGRYAMQWNDTDGFPRTVAQPQSRLAYGSTRTFPARVWMSVIAQPHNFLAARPQADDNTQPDTPRPDFSLILELDTSTIQQMVNDAALLVFTQNEAHIATGPFQANNPAASHARRFGRLGQEFNVGAAVIDENVFVYSNGAPFGLLYDGIDIGYISQNLSAQRNEDIMRNYRDAVVYDANRVAYPVSPFADLTQTENPTTNDGLRPVRIVATQPKGLNGAYLVLYLLSDGSIRAFHSLHREGFFAWSRWSFFDDDNRIPHVNDEGNLEFYEERLGDQRRKIIDITAEGSIVRLLDNRGNVYQLDGDETADLIDGAERAIGVEVELPTFALPDPRFPGEALINPKQVEYAMFHFNDLSGTTMVTAYGNDTDAYPMDLKPQFPGDYNPLLPEGSSARTLFRGQRKVELSNFYTGDIDTDKKNTLAITNSSTEAWELLRVETEVQIDSTEAALAFAGATARIRSGV